MRYLAIVLMALMTIGIAGATTGSFPLPGQHQVDDPFTDPCGGLISDGDDLFVWQPTGPLSGDRGEQTGDYELVELPVGEHSPVPSPRPR